MRKIIVKSQCTDLKRIIEGILWKAIHDVQENPSISVRKGNSNLEMVFSCWKWVIGIQNLPDSIHRRSEVLSHHSPEDVLAL